MNNNAISQTSANKLYVAHSVKQENEKKQSGKEEKETPAPKPQAQPNQPINRSYYNDTMGGGYQGL